MSGGDEWWNETTGDFNPSQTGQTNLDTQTFDPNTTYTPPGELAPADQWNFTPDPNAPGGYQAAAPGSLAPLDQVQFSNTTGQYPNDQSMTNAIANQTAGQYTPGVDAQGNATMGMSAAITQSSPQAGISNVPLGQGWVQRPGSPGYSVNIIPDYLPYLYNQQMSPGYLPGSGTYNQYPLDRPGLFGPVGPNNVMSNLRYGLGGTGDPTTGREPQTPDEWVQGGKLFNSTRMSNWGQGDQAGTGLDYIATLFLRPDTPSGINTAAWHAPIQFWQGLGQQVANGQIQPTARGWAALAAHGITPQMLGQAAVQQAASVGYGGGTASGGGLPGAPGAAGGGVTPGTVAPGPGQPTGGATGPMGPNTQAFNYQANYLDYLNAVLNRVTVPQMNNQTALGYLQMLANLRGPADLFQYLRVLGGTPGGIRDIVNASAGAYQMPRTGAIGSGGTSGPASIESVLAQMNDPNYGAEAQGLNLPAPNQINAQALLRMTPAQLQTLMSAYESQGWRPEDVLAIFRNSLPQYAGNTQAGRVALFG